MLLIPELAQAALVRAVARTSGSGGGPQADPPLVTSWTALTHNTGLPAGRASGPSSFLLLSLLLLLYDLMVLAAL